MKTVDHLDITLSISPSLKPVIENALLKFNDDFDYPVMKPKLKDGKLKVNSTDLIRLLGYIEHENLQELEWRRFYKNIELCLASQLTKSLNPDFQYHYKWCLTALANLPAGRFLNSESA